MEIFVVDTHALAWFFAQSSQLSSAVDSLLTQAEDNETQILIPTLVLAELTLISQKQRVPISISAILEAIQQMSSFIIVDFDFAVFQAFIKLPQEWDLHDRIIAATAKHYSAKLITRDEVLQNSAEIETFWE
jgi:PIN domain nuclease of toxin-antitoxin system